MTPEEWRAIKEILDGALELPAAERSAYLDLHCGGDLDRRRKVESLIEADDRAWSLMEAPAAASFGIPSHAGPASGDRIGVYQILGELGRGGMGIVYLARRADEHFDKKVAIKLASVGIGGDSLERRFRSERQIVASLDHPNIARLLDGGSMPDGRPYLVMEYVEGARLLEWCEARKLSTRGRLEIFLEVCSAVQYAHQHLVIHRDLKPANVLVTDDGVVKLLDFGIAKLIDPEPAGETADRTATLLRLFTPDYASPEQVRGEPVTTASDVYALGVVLYELLTGRRPYRTSDSSPAEMVRVVCETEPPKPSTAFRGSADRGEAPGRREKTLSGDLDTIVLKAMRKEPARRYSTVSGLAEDVRRYLQGLPVAARPDTLGYRAGKFVRRHRAAVSATALFSIALAGGLVMTLREARRARAAEARAERRFNDVRTLAHSFLFEFHDAIRDLPGSTPARALVVRRALEYLDGLARESAGDPGLRRELAEAYQKVGDVEGNPYHQNLGDLKGALASYDKAIALLEPVVASSKATDAERSTLANAYLVGGGMRVVAGDPARAVVLAEKGLALRRRLARSDPRDGKRATDLAQALQIYAFNLSAAGKSSESFEALREQAAILRDRLAAAPSDRPLRRSLGLNLYLTAGALQSGGDFDGARGAFERAALLLSDLLREDSESIQLRRDLGWVRMDLGTLHRSRDDLTAALSEYRLALPLFEWIVTADPKNTDGRLGVGMTHQLIGSIARASHEPKTALREFEQALSSYDPVLTADRTNAFIGNRIAGLYMDMAEAEEEAGRGSPERETRTRSERACRLFTAASDAFTRMKNEGRLAAVRIDASERAERARARCRSTAASPSGRAPGAPGRSP